VTDGGLMTIDGNGTTIHHNCTNGDSRLSFVFVLVYSMHRSWLDPGDGTN